MKEVPHLKKVSLRKSIYFRFATIFALCLLLGAGAQLIAISRGVLASTKELQQQSHWDTASLIAGRLHPTLNPSVNREAMERVLYSFSSINPDLEIFLLDREGKILYTAPDFGPRNVGHVDLGPIRKAIESESPELPLYGQDTTWPDRKTVFSAAPISINNQDGYIYVVLHSFVLEHLERFVGSFFVTRSVAVGLILTTLATMAVSALLFSYLTKRFRALTELLNQFESGDFSRRAEISNEDEIGKLAKTINSMADTVVEAKQVIEDRDSMRRQLVAFVAHDLRSPLVSIIGALEKVLKSPSSEVSDKNRELLNLARDSAFLQNSLASDLFELSLLEAKDRPLNLDDISLSATLRSNTLKFQNLASEKNIELTCSIPERELTVLADAQLISRVVSNLVENAIRHTPVNGKIVVSAVVEQTGALVQVHDSGPGIPEEKASKIFDAFYQAEATDHRGGLGLAIVKRILDMHQGESTNKSISVSRSYLGGAVFSFYLPFSDYE